MLYNPIKYLKKDLFQVIYHVTYRCNSRCKHCFNWKNLTDLNKQELTLDEITKISKNLPTFPWFLISGGEPFLREDMPQIIKIFYDNNNLKYVTLPTNGILSTKIRDQVKEILTQCNGISLTMSLSLDHIGAKHDSLRNTKGNFESLITTFNYLKELKKEHKNLLIKFNTVITNKNYKDLDEIISYVKRLEPDLHTFDFIRGDPLDKTFTLPPKEKIKEIIKKIKSTNKDYGGYTNLSVQNKLIKNIAGSVVLRYYDLFYETLEEKKQVIPCYAGYLSLVIYPYGDVSFCEMLEPFANLRDFDYNYKSIIKSQQSEKIKKLIKNKECYCYHPCYQYLNILYNPKYFIKHKNGI